MAVAHVVLGTVAPIPLGAFQVVNAAFQCDRFESAHLYIDLTLNLLTSLKVRVEFSYDKTTWYSLASVEAVPPNATLSAVDYSMTATGKYRAEIPVADKWVRFSVMGTGADASGSSVTLSVNLGTTGSV